MSEPAKQSQNASLDVTDIASDELPRIAIDRLQGVRENRFQTVIKQAALEDIHDHGKSSPEAEICGVLVGNLFQDECGPYLLVHASIRGDQAENRAAQVTFRAETWTHIQNEMDRLHPDSKIVGWYHTHPGFGIFLSGMDLFIQDNFFNLPWQIALVYDPSSGEEGVFTWRAGKSEPDTFLIQSDTDEEIRAKPGYEWTPPNELVTPAAIVKDQYATPSVMLLAIVAFVLSFAAALVMMYRPWENRENPSPAAATQPGKIAKMSIDQ